MTRNGQGVLDGIRVLRLIDKMREPKVHDWTVSDVPPDWKPEELTCNSECQIARSWCH